MFFTIVLFVVVVLEPGNRAVAEENEPDCGEGE